MAVPSIFLAWVINSKVWGYYLFHKFILTNNLTGVFSDLKITLGNIQKWTRLNSPQGFKSIFHDLLE